MSNLIITSVGTSIISNNLYTHEITERKIEDLMKKDKHMGTKDSDIFISKTYEKIKIKIDNENYYNLPSEIDSLMVSKNELKLSKNDTIVLFSTDTEAGKLCAEVNKRVLEYLNWEDVRGPIVIEGLRTQKFNEQEDISEIFKNAGLKNLKTQLDILNPQNYENRYFNITGGFKAIIPFVTILAFERKISLFYIYEDSDDLIVIKPPDKFTCSFESIRLSTKILRILRDLSETFREPSK